MGRERCPVCAMLGQKSSVRRLQPIVTQADDNAERFCEDCGEAILGARFRYACSRGHEFDGLQMHWDNRSTMCESCERAEEERTSPPPPPAARG